MSDAPTKLCDRCDRLYHPHPDWPGQPLCPKCLIALRHTETTHTATRMTTSTEIQQAWRHRSAQLWLAELTA